VEKLQVLNDLVVQSPVLLDVESRLAEEVSKLKTLEQKLLNQREEVSILKNSLPECKTSKPSALKAPNSEPPFNKSHFLTFSSKLSEDLKSILETTLNELQDLRSEVSETMKKTLSETFELFFLPVSSKDLLLDIKIDENILKSEIILKSESILKDFSLKIEVISS
jgi:hypothetical protein